MSVRGILFVVVVATVGGSFAAAAELVSSVDLSAFTSIAEPVTSVENASAYENVAWSSPGKASRRVYLAGMLGPSFASVSSPAEPSLLSDDTLLSAGGALGIAFERPRGWLRLEVEGRGRDTYFAPFSDTPSEANDTILTNNWSVMQNVWRDLTLTDRFGIYGGGGIGAGGYILGEQYNGEVRYVQPGSGFAWQAGGGVLWSITDRLTFDVGYRYFSIDTIQQASFVAPNQFTASELMFTLRFYEPFRRWRR